MGTIFRVSKVPRRIAAVMLGAGLCGCAGPAFGVDPDDKGEALALRRVFAPPQEEIVPPGTGKFLIFTREMVAGLWEFVPERSGDGVVKRVDSPRGTVRILPEYHPEPRHEVTHDRGLLAAYFFKWKGILDKVPEYAERRVAFTEDLRSFLWKTQAAQFPVTETTGLPSPTVFLHGDLDTGVVREIPCPPELVRDNALEIEWVVAP